MTQAELSKPKPLFPATFPILLPLFAWYAIQYLLPELFALPEGYRALTSAVSLVAGSLVYAWVVYGLFCQQAPPFSWRAVLAGSAKRIFPRFLLISLVVLALRIAGAMLLAPRLPAAAARTPYGNAALLNAPMLVLYLLRFLWQAGTVGERGKLWRGLGSGIRALGSGPCLRSALVFALVFTADTVLSGIYPSGLPLPYGWALALLRAALLSLAAVLLYSAFLRGCPAPAEERAAASPEAAAPELAHPAAQAGSSAPQAVQGLEPAATGAEPAPTLKAPAWPAALAFLPGMSLVALVLGLKSGRRNGWLSIRSMLVFGLGLFFTALYALLIAGWVANLFLNPGGQAPGQLAYSFQPQRWLSILWSVLGLLLLFTVHEFAHAAMATRLGDDTAKNQGRLTLNPLAHLDLFGSILLPALLLIRQSGMVFGWARPVPLDPEKLRRRRNGERLVAFAGPAMNLAVALGTILLILLALLLLRLASPQVATENIVGYEGPLAIGDSTLGPWFAPVLAFLNQFLATALVLGLVNLLPIPPLDGSWLLSSLLRGKWKAGFERLRKFGFLIALALFLTPALDYLLGVPLALAWGLLYLCAGFMGFA